jgi:hypothetical protein
MQLNVPADLEAQDAEESWTDEECQALSAHIEEGYLQVERGQPRDGAQAPRVKLLPFVEQQVFLEKRKDLIIDTAVVAPGLVSPDAVVLFRLVGYSELVQLMSKGLVGVDVILVQVTRTPEALFCASDIEPSSLNAPRLGTRLFRSQSGYRIDPRRLAGRDIAGEQREYCEQRTNRGVCRAIQR